MTSSTHRHWSLITIMVLAVAIGTTVVPSIVDNAAAGSGPLTVYGYVYDSGGTPVEGADVLVEVLRTGATLSDTTDSSGRYDVAFALSDWDTGDTVESTATSGSLVESETGIAPALGFMQIDVQFAYAIPEFGSFPGVLVATLMVGAVAVFAVRKRQA